MKNIHLTDNILQAYLLKEIEDDAVATHVAECPNCQAKLEEYQLLFNRVAETQPEAFSFDVVGLAMNHVTIYEQKKRKKQAFVFWGTLIALFIVVASIVIAFLPQILPIFGSTSILTTVLVAGTSFLVVLFLVLDLIRNYKLKEDQLFKNNLQPTR